MPKVSVIIPTHNPNKKYLHEALDSVFSQTFRDFEVIVVDDGSSVDTKETLKPYENRIRFFKKENGGVNTARLFGLKRAQGDYIALIDQDDRWEPDKLQKQVEFLDAYPELDLIFSDYNAFNEKVIFPKSALSSNKNFRKIPTEIASNLSSDAQLFTNNILYDYMRAPFIMQCTLMVRKKMCEKFEIFNTKTNGREFYEFALRTIHLLRIGFIDETLAYWRTHEYNVTHNIELFCNNTLIVCEDALNYPWMDARCKEFLHSQVFKAFAGLGLYYFLQGNFSKASKNFKAIMLDNRLHLSEISRWFFKFIFSKSIVGGGKVLWRGLKTFSKTGNKHG